MLRFATPSRTAVTLQLKRGELLNWTGGPVLLRVVSGTAWVTRPNDLGDHFLNPGDALELSEAGLIGAETALRLSVEVAPRGRSTGSRPAVAAAVLSRCFHAAGAAFGVSLPGALRKEHTP
jgi:Protein of unknown function (DUF2917)